MLLQHVVAAREMKRNGIPMDKLISVNWFNEVDIANIGAADAKGMKRGTNVAGGQDHALIKQIVADLYDKHTLSVEQVGGVAPDDFRRMNQALARLERFWTDQIRFRL